MLKQSAYNDDYNNHIQSIKDELYEVHRPDIIAYRNNADKVYPEPEYNVHRRSSGLGGVAGATAALACVGGLGGLFTTPFSPLTGLKIMGGSLALGGVATGMHALNDAIHPPVNDPLAKKREKLYAQIENDIDNQLTANAKSIYNNKLYKKYMLNGGDEMDNYDALWGDPATHKMYLNAKINPRLTKSAGVIPSQQGYYGARLASGIDAAKYRAMYDKVPTGVSSQAVQAWKNTEKKLSTMAPAERKAAELQLLKMFHK